MKKTIVLLCVVLIAFAVLFTACNRTGGKNNMTSGMNTTTTQAVGGMTTANETTSKGALESKAEEVGTTIKENLESIGKDISSMV